MNTDNFDLEFGPNKLSRCPHCGIKLDKDQICWDIEKEDHGVISSHKVKETKDER